MNKSKQGNKKLNAMIHLYNGEERYYMVIQVCEAKVLCNHSLNRYFVRLNAILRIQFKEHSANFTYSWHYSEFHG